MSKESPKWESSRCPHCKGRGWTWTRRTYQIGVNPLTDITGREPVPKSCPKCKGKGRIEGEQK